MDFDWIIADLGARAVPGEQTRVDEEDLLRWSNGDVTLAFQDALALAVARAYHSGRLSYTVCDDVMNDLWWIVMSGRPIRIPPLLREVFEAFDAGEYHRKKDRSDDPVADHTDPWITEIVLRHSGNDA